MFQFTNVVSQLKETVCLLWIGIDICYKHRFPNKTHRLTDSLMKRRRRKKTKMPKEDRSLRWRQFHCFNVICTAFVWMCTVFTREKKNKQP